MILTAFNCIFIYACGIVLGIMWAGVRRHEREELLHKAQQERGDYWFDRCKQLHREYTNDWETSDEEDECEGFH